MSSRYTGEDADEDKKPPLFKADIVLAIPNVVMKVEYCSASNINLVCNYDFPSSGWFYCGYFSANVGGDAERA